MGGNLIRDIIEESEDFLKIFIMLYFSQFQNPEVLREYIYKSGYKNIDEELSKRRRLSFMKF